MSRTLHLKDEICAICQKAGIDLKSVAEIVIGPTSVTFEVYESPLRMGPGRKPLTVFITLPWDLV